MKKLILILSIGLLTGIAHAHPVKMIHSHDNSGDLVRPGDVAPPVSEGQNFEAMIENDILYVMATTDDCNEYGSRLVQVSKTCKDSKDKMCRPDKAHATISIASLTRKRCFGTEVRLFEFDLGEKPDFASELIVLWGEKEKTIKW